MSAPETPVPAVGVIEVIPFALDETCPLPLATAEAWLSDEERTRADRFRFPHLRERYLRGRGVMRGVLGRMLDRHPAELEIAEGAHGKPCLVGDDTGFNLSHSDARAVLAVGRVRGIGIDVERIERSVDLVGVAKRCFRETEIAWMEGHPPERRAEAFFWIWTAKEARMKASGEGFRLEPQRIEVAFSGCYPVSVLEPRSPQACLAALPFDVELACTVVALEPFEVRVSGCPEWR